MTCEELVDLLLEYVDENLTAEQVAAIKSHVCDCPPCAIKIETYQITIRVSRALPKTAPLPVAFEARLRAVLASEFDADTGRG